MKATGIVRRIDDLGRVVIPKELRRTMHIQDGSSLEIFTDKDGELIFKKYSPVGELGDFAGQLCESLRQAADGIFAVCDRDAIIAASGAGKKELLDKHVSAELAKLMDERESFHPKDGALLEVCQTQGQYLACAVSPIISDGSVLGCVMALTAKGTPAPEYAFTLTRAAANFLGHQTMN